MVRTIIAYLYLIFILLGNAPRSASSLAIKGLGVVGLQMTEAPFCGVLKTLSGACTSQRQSLACCDSSLPLAGAPISEECCPLP